MDAAQWAALAAIAVGAAAYVASERLGSRALAWASKPVAAAGFVALALVSGADAAIVAALALSAVGDVLLIPRDVRVFRAGILAFLAAHVAFVVAFALRAPAWRVGLWALVPLVLAALVVARWILPRVEPRLKGAVVAYVVVITAMVATAAAASWGGGPLWLVVAALGFWANDVLVARDRFVERAFWHRAVGLPLYYAAQAAFALA